MAIVSKVPELVAQKFGGVEKVNLSEVQRDTALTYSTASRWVKGRVDRVDFAVLEVWCKYLGVQPGDILIYREDA